MQNPKSGFLIDRHHKICDAYRGGKKTIILEGREFTMRKVTREVIVQTKHNPQGVLVKEHWLVVAPMDGGFPRANLGYPTSQSNSRTDLL